MEPIMYLDSLLKIGKKAQNYIQVMPDLIRHPWGFTGQEWIPVSSTGMTESGEKS